MKLYKCKFCDKIYEWDADAEQSLWGHIQLEHKDIFNEIQNFDTPYMLEECYKSVSEMEFLNRMLRRYMWVYEIVDGDKGFVLAIDKSDAIKKLSHYYDEDVVNMIDNEEMYVYDAEHSYIDGDVFNIVPW